MIVATTIGCLSAAAIGLGVLCFIFVSWRRRRREGRLARERERRDRKERQDAIELRNMKLKENLRKAKLEEELEKALIQWDRGREAG